MFEEGTRLINFRFPVTLVAELDEAKSWLQKASVSELVREAIREYLERHEAELSAHRRAAKQARARRGED